MRAKDEFSFFHFLFAKQYMEFPNDTIEIIKHSRKSFVFTSDKDIWIKKAKDKNGEDIENPLFDVTMGSVDGAEVCELIGTYLLSLLSGLIDKAHVALYRDDGLCILKGSGPELDRKRKAIERIFKANGLCITDVVISKQVDYLDVHLNLADGTYRPYRNMDSKPMYLNTGSNHPPQIIKNIPRLVNKRLIDISSNKTVFDDAKSPYQDALIKAGHKVELKYEEFPAKRAKRVRSRKVTWYNPPWDGNVKGNFGKKFLLLIDKHFPPDHALSKILNRNTLKLSYSTMPNMKRIISAINRKKLNDASNIHDSNKALKCTCHNKEECPFVEDGRCSLDAVIYRANVKILNDIRAPDQRIYEGSEYMGVEINTPAVYATSKAAVIGLTKYLATYWAKDNIRVNAITPGGVESGQNEQFQSLYSKRVPLGRMGQASEMVAALVYLASDASSYVTGQNLIVDGGLTAW